MSHMIYFHPVDANEEDKRHYNSLLCVRYRNQVTGQTAWKIPKDAETPDDWKPYDIDESEIDSVSEKRLKEKYNEIPITEIIDGERIPTGETRSRNNKIWIMLKEED